MQRFLSAIDWINRQVGVLSFLVLLMTGVLAFEVTSRFVFNNPTIWAHETTIHIFGGYLILGAGYVLLKKAHIRVDIFWGRLSPRKKAIFDLITSSLAFLMVTVLLIEGWRIAWESWQLLERSCSTFAIPLYPAKTCIVIGAFLLLIQLIAKFIRDLHLALTGREYV